MSLAAWSKRDSGDALPHQQGRKGQEERCIQVMKTLYGFCLCPNCRTGALWLSSTLPVVRGWSTVWGEQWWCPQLCNKRVLWLPGKKIKEGAKDEPGRASKRRTCKENRMGLGTWKETLRALGCSGQETHGSSSVDRRSGTWRWRGLELQKWAMRWLPLPRGSAGCQQVPPSSSLRAPLPEPPGRPPQLREQPLAGGAGPSAHSKLSPALTESGSAASSWRGHWGADPLSVAGI